MVSGLAQSTCLPSVLCDVISVVAEFMVGWCKSFKRAGVGTQHPRVAISCSKPSTVSLTSTITGEANPNTAESMVKSKHRAGANM